MRKYLVIASILLSSVLASAATSISSPLTATATVGVPFTYQITVSGTGTGYAATGLPAGLTYVAATGVVSGTPTVSGVFNVTLGATLSGNGFTSATLVLTVNPASGGTVTPPPVITPPATLFCATDPNPACGVQLSWTAPVPPSNSVLAVTGYLVFRTVSGSTTATQLTKTAITATTYLDNTIAPSTTYEYDVVSVDAAGTQSVPSNIAQVIVAAAPSVPTPATPVNLTALVIN